MASVNKRRAGAWVWSCGAAMALAGGALAAGGPDVIVGDLDGSEPFGAQTVNGVTRYSYCIGTVSCNIGTRNLLWVADSNQHPVIGQNVYRLKNNRMEQIGQSWLKNGFTALQQNLCGSCNGYGGTVLGVGCSDPYSGTLNGNQARLGPRSWVNPATGEYTFNAAGWPAAATGEGTINRRLQILLSDIDPAQNAGAVYYGETQYISYDDAQAGNGWNNVSYRTMTFSTTGDRRATMTGSTVRQKCALEAWATADPTNVSVFPIDVPGDGRFFVAARVHDNGNGTWHYEYAVENLTSDRAGGGFTVALPAGAVVTNAESRNPFYHSGEPYDNRFFLPTITATATEAGVIAFRPRELGTIGAAPESGELPWSKTGVKATVQNAVRWGTMYNFRFDCTVAPGAALGTGAITLAKAGTGAHAGLNDVLFSIKTPGGAALPNDPPFNDEFTSPGTLREGPNALSSFGATDSPLDVCSDGGSSAARSDVWYTYTFSSNCPGNVVFSTCGSSFPAKLSVYSGVPGEGNALGCAAGNLASCPAGSGGVVPQSSVTTPAVNGTTYSIRVSGVNAEKGMLVLNVASPSGCANPPAPANDLCANAQWIADGVPITADNLGSGTDYTTALVNGCSNPSGRDVWYRYRPAVGGPVRITTNVVNALGSTGLDTLVSVHASCGAAPLTCNDNSGIPSASSNIAAFNMTAGTTYLIRVAGRAIGSTIGDNARQGVFTLWVIGGGGSIPTPPANDHCAAASNVGVGATAFNTTDATTDGPATSGCAAIAAGNIEKDAWFRFTATTTGSLRASTCGSSFDTRLAVYSGDSCGDLNVRLLACSDNFECETGTTQSELTVPITSGEVYLVRVGGATAAAGGGGGGTLTLTQTEGQGACCRGTVCTVTTGAACASGFQGYGSACGPAGNPTTCCPANFDQADGVTIDDIFVFLNAWFAGSASANIDGVGGVEINDIFVFLNLWFTGC